MSGGSSVGGEAGKEEIRGSELKESKTSDGRVSPPMEEFEGW